VNSDRLPRMRTRDKWFMAIGFVLSGWFACMTVVALMDGHVVLAATSPVLMVTQLMLAVRKLSRVA
jgi:hypothetical protein